MWRDKERLTLDTPQSATLLQHSWHDYFSCFNLVIVNVWVFKAYALETSHSGSKFTKRNQNMKLFFKFMRNFLLGVFVITDYEFEVKIK